MKDKKPNLIVILSDDQGAWALGCYGNPEIHTPNLDRLAASGVRMTHFYCASPVCSPARATLLTGKMPSAHGVHDWIQKGNLGPNAVAFLEGQETYPHLLSQNGYRCGLSGKWHLGASEEPQQGFAHWYAYALGGGSYLNPPMVRNGELREEAGYVTDLITDDAITFIQNASKAKDPFYLSVHYTAPHYPWLENHPEKYRRVYANCPFASCPQEPLAPWLSPVSLTGKAQANLRENLIGYFSAVSAMDEGIGRILDTLAQLGLEEDTLVCFLSDNGFSCGQHGFWGKGNGTVPINMYESSVCVPAIFSHKGHTAPSVCSQLISACDLMPTLLDYVQLPLPQGDFPGRSFAPLLRGEGQERQEDVVIYDEYGSVRMIRSQAYKYIHRYPAGPHELYDLRNDPQERHNLAQQPAFDPQRREMRARLEGWFARYATVENDGLREPVAGNGQTGLSGLKGNGQDAFLPLEEKK